MATTIPFSYEQGNVDSLGAAVHESLQKLADLITFAERVELTAIAGVMIQYVDCHDAAAKEGLLAYATRRQILEHLVVKMIEVTKDGGIIPGFLLTLQELLHLPPAPPTRPTLTLVKPTPENQP